MVPELYLVNKEIKKYKKKRRKKEKLSIFLNY
jgi:hypothetical protein